MSRAWQVVLVAPEGYSHWRVFEEPAVLLQAALLELGYECTLVQNHLDPDRVNVVLGYHLLELDPALQTLAFVPFQMEQLGRGGGSYDKPRARAVLRSATAVWDFSARNVDILAADGIAATIVPLGYHAALETVPRSGEQDIDVLFSGSITPRRAEILDALQAAGVEVGVLFGCYGEDKQAALARARIHLHIHASDAALFQQPRIAHLLNNRQFVLSETAADDPYPRVELPQLGAEELAGACLHYITHPEERAQVATRCYERFREHYSMAELVRPGIDAVERALRGG